MKLREETAAEAGSTPLSLAAAGHNLRLLRVWLIRRLAFLRSLLAISKPAAQLPSPQLATR